MKKIFGALIVAVIGIAYFAGYWPERQNRLAAEATMEATRANLERAEAHNRLYGLQSQLIQLLTTVEARNFGDAQGQATAFFNAARTEADRPDQNRARPALESICAGRDAMTVALTQNDPAALEMLRGAMARLREALGEGPFQVAADPTRSPLAPLR